MPTIKGPITIRPGTELPDKVKKAVLATGYKPPFKTGVAGRKKKKAKK